MIKLPFGVDINNLIHDLKVFSWEAADILLFYSERIKNFKQKKDKINYIQYILTPKGIAERTKLTLNFMKRKMKEYDDLKKEL